jgi:hypothetical protein
MDSSDAKKAQKNRDHLQDVVQVENPSEPTDDYEWLEKSIDTEVSHGVLPDDHDKKSPISFSGRSNGTKRTFRNDNHTK